MDLRLSQTDKRGPSLSLSSLRLPASCSASGQTSRLSTKMDIQARFGGIASKGFSSRTQKSSSWNYSSAYSSPLPIIPCCSKKDFQEPQRNGDGEKNDKGNRSSVDWDKAWSSFKKQGKKNRKKNIFSQFSPNKYVSWNPRRSEYPLSEEVDPIKRTERSNLTFWTSSGFTLGGAIVIVTFLLVYTLLAPPK